MCGGEIVRTIVVGLVRGAVSSGMQSVVRCQRVSECEHGSTTNNLMPEQRLIEMAARHENYSMSQMNPIGPMIK